MKVKQKGKLYHGAPGAAKTTTLRTEFDAWEDKSKLWTNARGIVTTALKDGLLAMNRYNYLATHLFIDDIGHEPLTVTHFGTTFAPMAEFIQARYDYYDDAMYTITTHFTTNLTPEQLRQRYGEYIFDRLIEMCEWYHMEGESFRK